MFDFDVLTDQQLEELRTDTTRQAASQLEVLARVLVTVTRNAIDKELTRRRDRAAKEAERAKPKAAPAA